MTTPCCPRCLTPFDTDDAAAQHLWKSQDGDHDDVTSLDVARREVREHGESPDGEPLADGPATVADPSGDGGDRPVADGAGLGLPGEPDAPDRGDDVVDDESETESCPECGADLEHTEAELRARFGHDPFACDACGNRMQVAA